MDEQYIIVDSRFRNFSYPLVNSYSVFMNTPFYNVAKAELVTAFLPKLKRPDQYVFLDIDEFRSKFGTHLCMSNASYQSVIVSYNPDGSYVTQDIKYNNPIVSGYFAQLFYGDTAATSNLVYTEQQSYRSSVEFRQPIESLKQLTIRWVDRFNQPVEFNDPNEHHVFVIRLYTRTPTVAKTKNVEEELPKLVEEVRRKSKPEDVQTLAALVTGIFVFLLTALTG